MVRLWTTLFFFLCQIATLSAQEAHPEATEPGPTTDRFFSEFLNMLSTLGLVVVGMIVVAWLLKRMLRAQEAQTNTTSTIKIHERRAISTKTTLYLLEVNNREYVIAETMQGVTLLNESRPSAPTKFESLLDNTTKHQENTR